jgi:hypothetical protein
MRPDDLESRLCKRRVSQYTTNTCRLIYDMRASSSIRDGVCRRTSACWQPQSASHTSCTLESAAFHPLLAKQPSGIRFAINDAADIEHLLFERNLHDKSKNNHARDERRSPRPTNFPKLAWAWAQQESHVTSQKVDLP